MRPKKLKNSLDVPASLLKKLKEKAEKYRKRAYAPYSQCHVGAAVLTQDEKIFGGCNIENASYGGTICAERTAILKAISEKAQTPLKAISVASSSDEAWPPCGLCLQVMSEFCAPETVISISGLNNRVQRLHFKDLLPKSFTPDFLTKKKGPNTVY
jgi:cytidine deaminase